jgi:hypothetical protein
MLIESKSWIAGPEALDVPYEPAQFRLSMSVILLRRFYLESGRGRITRLSLGADAPRLRVVLTSIVGPCRVVGGRRHRPARRIEHSAFPVLVRGHSNCLARLELPIQESLCYGVAVLIRDDQGRVMATRHSSPMNGPMTSMISSSVVPAVIRSNLPLSSTTTTPVRFLDFQARSSPTKNIPRTFSWISRVDRAYRRETSPSDDQPIAAATNTQPTRRPQSAVPLRWYADRFGSSVSGVWSNCDCS